MSENVEKLTGLKLIIALIESSPGQLFWSTTKTLYSPEESILRNLEVPIVSISPVKLT